MRKKKKFSYDPYINFLTILSLLLPIIVLIYCLIFYPEKEEKKTETYELEGYAVNSVTLKTEDWNIWRVRNCNLEVDKHYIITFDDNGTIGVEDDIIIDVREKDS